MVLRASDSLAVAGRHKERGGFHSSLVKWGQQLILLYKLASTVYFYGGARVHSTVHFYGGSDSPAVVGPAEWNATRAVPCVMRREQLVSSKTQAVASCMFSVALVAAAGAGAQSCSLHPT